MRHHDRRAYHSGMRVVAGSLRGRIIVAPEGRDTRPTTDRVREAMFNALTSSDAIEGAYVLDLFSGSGALGIESLSRGAAHCTFVEKDRAALAAIRKNIETLGIGDRATVVAGDALSRLGNLDRVDLVVADPPYGFANWTGLLASLEPVVVDDGLVVAESGSALGRHPGWETVREKRYGRTWVTFLRRTPD